MKKNQKKIGIFGGTFNPIHKAHIHIIESFLSQIDPDKCFLVPANISPFKQDESKSEQDIQHIINMLDLIVANIDKLEISDFEIINNEISYTYRTVKHFKNVYPDAELYLLIGGDHVRNFVKWKNWEYIIENARLCIAGRPKTFSDEDKAEFDLKFTNRNLDPIWLDSDEIEISSSFIRESVKIGNDVSSLLHQKIYDYIKKHKLYLA